MGMNIEEIAQETLTNALEKMEKGGRYGQYGTMMVSMMKEEVEYLLTMTQKTEKTDKWETAYQCGFEYGYQMAIKDVAKRVRRMRWYGGGYKKEHADGLPGIRAGNDETMQREL